MTMICIFAGVAYAVDWQGSRNLGLAQIRKEGLAEPQCYMQTQVPAEGKVSRFGDSK